MTASLKSVANQILSETTERAGGAPGVVAMATDRNHNI
jgi:hypothetical protein